MTKRKLILDTVKVGDVIEKLKELPDNSIDLVVTSPPYNKRNGTHGWLVRNETYTNFDDHLPEDKYQSWQIEVLNELFRVTKPGGSIFYNHKIRWSDGVLIHPYSWIAKSKWCIKQEIIWDRAIAANMRGWRFWQIDERIYWLYKPKGKYLIGKELQSRHAKFSSIWRIRPASRTPDHPAPFPIELPTRIIYSILSRRGGVVLDPFCGTGTTLVVAKLLGHHYYGIDTSSTYVKDVRRRLRNASDEELQLKAELKKHIIDDTFVERKERGTISWPFGPKNKGSKAKKRK